MAQAIARNFSGIKACAGRPLRYFSYASEVTRPPLTSGGLFLWWAFVTLWWVICGNRLLTSSLQSQHTTWPGSRWPLYYRWRRRPAITRSGREAGKGQPAPLGGLSKYANGKALLLSKQTQLLHVLFTEHTRRGTRVKGKQKTRMVGTNADVQSKE